MALGHLPIKNKLMRISFSLLATLTGLTLLATGCAGPERKLGRGMLNATEFTRLGAMQRSVEQTAIFNAPNYSYATGVIRGFDQSVYTTAMGAYQIVTFPAGNYLTQSHFDQKYVPQTVAYPDSYHPGLIDTGTFQTDQYIGFSGGSIAPFIPGNRFTIFGD